MMLTESEEEMQLKLKEIFIFYEERNYTDNEPLVRVSSNKYTFMFNDKIDEKQLENEANKRILKLIKRDIDVEKKVPAEENDSFFLTIFYMNKTNKKLKEINLGFEVIPEKVFDELIKQRNELLQRLSKTKIKNKEIIIFFTLSKGLLLDSRYNALLEVNYIYNVVRHSGSGNEASTLDEPSLLG